MSSKRFKTNILVRDGNVEMMQSKGIVVNYRVLEDDEYLDVIKNKVVEEAKEIIDETERGSIIEEIADVMEALECLKDHLAITTEEVELARQLKLQKRGSFKKKYFTNYVEIEEDSEAINYYLNKPHKYPEIKD